MSTMNIQYKEISDQIEKVSNIDRTFTHELATASDIIRSNIDLKHQIENDNFVKRCPSLIRQNYEACKRAVDRIVKQQQGVTLNSSFLLTNYIDRPAAHFKADEFVSVFCDAYMSFRHGMESFLRLTDPCTDSTAPGDLQKIGKAYNTMGVIQSQLDRLVPNHLESVYSLEIARLSNDIKAYQKSEAEYHEKMLKSLQEEIDMLEKLLHEEEQRMLVCTLSKNLQMPTEFPKDYRLYIGKDVVEKAKKISLENLPYKKEVALGNAAFVSGYEKDLNSNILVDASNGDEDVANAFADDVIMKFLASYPTKFKKVVALHNQAGSPLLRIMSRVNGCGTQAEFAFQKGSIPVVNTEEEIESMLSLLDKRVNDVCSLLGVSGERDIYSYNAKHQDTAEPLTLVVVKDFPNGFTRGRSLNLFQRVYEQGNKAGVIMLVFYDEKFVTGEYGDMPRAWEYINSADYSYRLKMDDTAMVRCPLKDPFVPLQHSVNFSEASFFAYVNEELKKQNKPIDLFEIQTSEDFKSSKRRTEFSEKLSIPLGKFGGQTMSVELSSADKAHLVVNGGTGSGKSAFLHTLILSAAYNYSPDELEINLFDFKDGVGFKMYKEKRLPHINFIALENKIEDAQDILTYLNSLMTERNKLISSFDGVNSLKGYNAKVASGNYPNKPKIPRTLIIIDEYQFLLMNEKCVAVLENIARQGRSAGMSLVLVSQDVPTDSSFSKIKQLLDHRFAFRGSPDNVDRLISGTGKRAAELELQKGLCFYEANDGLVKTMRTAFSGDDEQLSKNIDKIVAKYPGKYRPMQIVGSPKPLLVRDVKDVPMPTEAQLRHDYSKSGVCHFNLGRYCLTQENVEYVANEDNTLLLIVGNYIKSKQIATSLILGMLRTLRHTEGKRNRVLLADLCEQRRLLNAPSPLAELIAKKNELEDEGDESTLDALTCFDAGSFEDMVNYIYDVYEERCSDSRADLDPIEVMILSADSLNGTGRVFDRLREVIINGKKCDIYFTLQVDSLESQFSKTALSPRSGLTIKDLILLSENEDDYSFTSLEIRNALGVISGLVGSKVASEYIKSLEKAPLHHAYSFIVDDGSIRKYNHFQYEQGWTESLIAELQS